MGISQRSLLHVDPSLLGPARAVADELEETSKNARRKINRAIQLVGMEHVVEIVAEAKRVNGSLMVHDGSRPRTLGGCFFALLQKELGESMSKVQNMPVRRKDQEANDDH